LSKSDDDLEQLEERLTALYANAENEIRAKCTDYMAGFEKDDKAKRELVEQGKISEDEYTAWRKNAMIKSTSYSKAVESMSNMLVKTDVAAMAIVNGELPAVVAESYDFVQALGYEAARGTGLTAGTFQIYNAETVEILIRDNPDMMPKPSVNIPEDKKWNKDRINRELTQGILQGESIPQIAERLQKVTTMDRNSAIRNARTAMTGAENMGRYQSAQDLREKGIPVEEVWSAASDSRTRESHRLLDGTTRDASGYFGVGIIATPLRFAGDPAGDPEEIYNCRCRTSIILQGIDHSKDDQIYAEFMKQFEDGRDKITLSESEAKTQQKEQQQPKEQKQRREPQKIRGKE
jgi:SPP1 gp7 family putative phage head morphogenesis protein